jgi:Fe-S oxidoreductase
MPRYAARIDSNQQEIVKALRKIPGVTVELNHDDILCGYRGATYWYEIKSKRVVSRKTGQVLDSGIKESQKRLLDTFTGHYKIVSTLDEILEDMGIL